MQAHAFLIKKQNSHLRLTFFTKYITIDMKGVRMKKIYKKIATLSVSALIMLGAMSGCSDPEKIAEDNLNTTILDIVNSQNLDKEFESYTMLGTNFVLNGEYYDIDIGGLAKYNNNDDEFLVNLNFELDKEFLKDVNPKISLELIEVLNKVLPQQNIKKIDTISINDFKELNKSVNSSIEEYSPDSSLTYIIKNIRFNQENKEVSFDTYTNICLKVPYILNVYNPILKITQAQVEYKYQHHTVKNNITIKISLEELKEMELNNELIFDKFVSVVNKNDTSSYTITTTNIDKNKIFEDGSDYSI